MRMVIVILPVVLVLRRVTRDDHRRRPVELRLRHEARKVELRLAVARGEHRLDARLRPPAPPGRAGAAAGRSARARRRAPRRSRRAAVRVNTSVCVTRASRDASCDSFCQRAPRPTSSSGKGAATSRSVWRTCSTIWPVAPAGGAPEVRAPAPPRRPRARGVPLLRVDRDARRDPARRRRRPSPDRCAIAATSARIPSVSARWRLRRRRCTAVEVTRHA